MAVTWEPLVRSISNLEKAHTQVPSNIPGKFQLDRTSGRRETAVTDRHTDRQTDRHTEIAGIIDRYICLYILCTYILLYLHLPSIGQLCVCPSCVSFLKDASHVRPNQWSNIHKMEQVVRLPMIGWFMFSRPTY